MIKSTEGDITDSALLMRLLPMIKRFTSAITSFGSICVLSEDTVYKRHFIRDYMPELYKQHTSELYINCVFCANLVRYGCHRNCLKCSTGTYIHCSPPLPGILYYNTRHPYIIDNLSVPWYFRETCSSFSRLSPNQYFRNLHAAFSSIDIYNFEALEGLEKGLSAGEKPCHICASIDYELYRKCSGQGDFDIFTPCHKITTELSTIYQNQS